MPLLKARVGSVLSRFLRAALNKEKKKLTFQL
jgi:hypothetical protein